MSVDIIQSSDNIDYNITQRMSAINITIDQDVINKLSNNNNSKNVQHDASVSFIDNPLDNTSLSILNETINNNNNNNNIMTQQPQQSNNNTNDLVKPQVPQKLTRGNTNSNVRELYNYIHTNQLKNVITLLAKGINVNTKYHIKPYNTVLHQCAQYNTATILEYIIKEYINNNNNENIDNNSNSDSLHIDIVNSYNQTSLHISCIHNSINVVQLLLKHNANIEAIDIYGHTPLQYANKYAHTNIIKLLIKHKQL